MLSRPAKALIRMYGVILFLLLALVSLVGAIIFWHPLGWIASIALAASVYVVFGYGMVKLGRRFRPTVSEEDEIALQDRILGLDKEPPKDWFISP